MKKAKTAELLGQKIKSLRKSNRLTQEQLGAECGINYKYIGAIERGEENPSLSVLQKISASLGIELWELFKFQHEERDPAKLRKVVVDIINRMGTEDEEKLRLVFKVLNAIK